MPSHLELTVKAVSKALDEAKKLEKEFKAATKPAEKEKLKKMAEAAKKIAVAHFDTIEAAKQKDRVEMDGIFKSMGV
jgi:hypothetical protein